MKMRLELIGSFCFYFGYLVFKTFCISTEFPERQTVFGKVRGRVSERIIGSPVEEYLGIPFASPPVGAKRFQVWMHVARWCARRALACRSECIIIWTALGSSISLMISPHQWIVFGIECIHAEQSDVKQKMITLGIKLMLEKKISWEVIP